MSTKDDSMTVFELLKQTTTIGTIQNFLKGKELKFSAGSWDDLYAKRVNPALIDGVIAVSDLISLLRSTEEYGRQHIFLFKCSPEDAKKMMDHANIKSILESHKISDVLDSPKLLEQSSTPTIVDVRWEEYEGGSALVCKLVETRRYDRFVEDVREEGRLLKIYEQVEERVVNIIKLHSNGFLELRIKSHANSSDYQLEIARLWANSLLFDKSLFSPVPLAKAKKVLWDDRAKLTGKVRYTNSTLKNDQGNSIRALSGSATADLSKDNGASSGIDAFIAHDGYCDSTNIWFIQNINGQARETHVYISQGLNEFAIPAACTKDDYEHVLQQIRKFNS